MNSKLELRLANASDRDEIAKLIQISTNRYYQERLGRPPIFDESALATTDFVDLYNALDGSNSLVCVEADTIVGSCFYHERESHVSLGIMNAHPDHFGKGIAKLLLQHILSLAEKQNKPVRLVSSCFNLDSYSLYSRFGFSPFEFYQDVLVNVPDSGFDELLPDGLSVRSATLDDIDAIAKLEQSVSGITRRGDYRHFIESPDGLWHASVAFRSGDKSDQLTGFLASGFSKACNMIGPGVALDEESAQALVVAELNQHKGRTPVMLVPGRFKNLVAAIYKLGGRNCETHVAQSTRPTSQPNGITLPTFLPESG